MASAWGASWGAYWGNSWGAITAQPPIPANLGAAPRTERRRKPQDEREDDQIAEAIQPAMVSRLRDEMLSAAMAADVVERAQDVARKAKRRKEAAILLLMSV